jgi:hypothetical protein
VVVVEVWLVMLVAVMLVLVMLEMLVFVAVMVMLRCWVVYVETTNSEANAISHLTSKAIDESLDREIRFSFLILCGFYLYENSLRNNDSEAK